MKARILIVDDALFMRTMLKNILVEAGHEVVGEAASGQEAITKFHEVNPDLTTLDIIMPGTQGLDVLQQMREEDPDAKVIMISALGQERLVGQARERGAAGYIVKPFKEENVVSEVERVLGNEE